MARRSINPVPRMRPDGRTGSIATERSSTRCRRMSASRRKRTTGQNSRQVRFVPLAVIAAIRGKRVIWNIRPAFLGQSALMPANLITLANFSV